MEHLTENLESIFDDFAALGTTDKAQALAQALSDYMYLRTQGIANRLEGNIDVASQYELSALNVIENLREQGV
jgi:hypothetical protein